MSRISKDEKLARSLISQLAVSENRNDQITISRGEARYILSMLKGAPTNIVSWEDLFGEDHPQVIWVEDKAYSRKVFRADWDEDFKQYTDDEGDWTADKSDENKRDYGQVWRAWTSCPSEEIREREEWDEPLRYFHESKTTDPLCQGCSLEEFAHTKGILHKDCVQYKLNYISEVNKARA